MIPEIDCHYYGNSCKFHKHCDDVTDFHFPIQIEIYDEYQSLVLRTETKDMKISGEDFGDYANTCYLPVFRSELDKPQTWFLGSQMVNRYYIVLDQTPKEEKGKEYIQVGFGIKDLNNIFMKQQYDPGSSLYHP